MSDDLLTSIESNPALSLQNHSLLGVEAGSLKANHGRLTQDHDHRRLAANHALLAGVNA